MNTRTKARAPMRTSPQAILKHEFLTEMAIRHHQESTRVFDYFFLRFAQSTSIGGFLIAWFRLPNHKSTECKRLNYQKEPCSWTN